MDNFKIGQKVLFSVFPYYRMKSGIVVDGGIELTDKESLEELGDMSPLASWDDVLEVKQEGEL